MSVDANGGNLGGQEPAAPAPAAPAPATVFTQDQLNAKLAENKRGLQRQLEAAATKAAAFDALQAQVSEMIAKGGFAGVEDLSGFAAQVEDTISKTRSEAEQQKSEAARLKKDLELAQKVAGEATSRWTRAAVERAISDEVGPRATSPGALELIRMKLASDATVKDDGTVVIRQNLKNEEGQPYVKELPVKEAVALLEADVTNYGPLFKSTVNAGTGGPVDGVRRTPEGQVDFATLDFAKFMELSKKAPDVLARSVAALRK